MEQRANLILARRDGFMRNEPQGASTLRPHERDEHAPAPLQYATVPPPVRKWFARAAVALSAYPLLIVLSIHVVPVFHGPQSSAEFIA